MVSTGRNYIKCNADRHGDTNYEKQVKCHGEYNEELS